MNLPTSWQAAKISQIIDDIVGGGTPTKTNPENFKGNIPFMTVKDMRGRLITNTIDKISEDALHNSATTLVPPDTLVIATRMALGKIAKTTQATAINQDIKAIYPSNGIEKRYIEHFWRYRAQYIESIGTGTTVKGIRLEDIRSLSIPVAPSNEQRRIADKLDRVLARVDAANEHLSRVAPLIKRFRKSVLAAAVSGQLTDARALPSQDWKTAKLGDLGTLARGKSKHRPRNDPSLYGGRYPFIQTGDIANSNGLITHHSKTYNDKGLAQSELWPKGTLCITIAANIADTAILDYDACFPDSIVGFLADESTCIAKFVKHSIDVIKEDIERLAPATAQKNINLAILSEIPIRIPSVEEQSEIVRRVEKLFAFADRLEERLSQTQAAVQKLTPALLAKAFRGELVPQDPNDEPASELLKRLQESRTECAKPSRAKKPRAKKSP